MVQYFTIVLLLSISALVSCKNIAETETFLTEEDFELAKTLTIDDLKFGDGKPRRNIWDSGKPDGDLIRPNRAQFAPVDGDVLQSAIRGSNDNRWSDNKIPYALSSAYNRRERATIAAAIADFKKFTCLEFIPRNGHVDYLYITKDGGCWSMLGRTGGKQELSLDNGCVYKGTVIHELLHAVGFIHEQSRSDRDSYVRIEWNNIKNGMADQFDKYTTRETNNFGLPYDYQSVMHYDALAFSKNDRRTIVTINPHGAEIGQEDGFSQMDIKKVNTAFQCPDTGVEVITSKPEPETTSNREPETTTPSTSVETEDPTIECEDAGYDCDNLVSSIGCDVDFVQQSCQLTCGKCDDGSSQTTTLEPIGSECYDLAWDCDWLASEVGCGKNFVQRQCQATCKVCAEGTDQPTDRPVNQCNDKSNDCDWLVEQRGCHRLNVAKKCKLSCGLCDEDGNQEEVTDEPTVGEVQECVDSGSKRECKRMVRRGQCEDPFFFEQAAHNCPKSCQFVCSAR